MHILIVEDERGISNFLQQGLEEEGYTTTVAHDGENGFNLILSLNPDLILLDWMLPKMEGLEICKAIRGKNIYTPIIFLTAKDTVQEIVEGLQAGANDYIKKPFSFDELLARIDVHLRKTNKTLRTSLQLGDIVLDKNIYRVTQNGTEIQFTQREFELLEYLIINKGKVCSRQDIIENIWNIDFDYETGVIDVFINSIRKKLNLDKETGYIKTIRGVGYLAND